MRFQIFRKSLLSRIAAINVRYLGYGLWINRRAILSNRDERGPNEVGSGIGFVIQHDTAVILLFYKSQKKII